MPNAREELDCWKSLLGHSTGGIDLGLERAGMVTRWFCEIDPHCRNVLARHWPGLPIYGDITAVDWSGVPRVDVLAGGFPCQPVSSAGQRQAQTDARWLWPEFARAIRALRPRYVLVENVANLLAVNGGSAMGEVVGDLATSGYDAEWDCIPAEAIGALHERDRLWIVAYVSASRRRPPQRHLHGRQSDLTGSRPTMADTNGGRRESRSEWTSVGGVSVFEPSRDSRSLRALADAHREPMGRPTESWSQRGIWRAEPDVGRVADGVPHRVDRLRSLGNAVVPQVVEWIGRRIVAFDEDREVSAA